MKKGTRYRPCNFSGEITNTTKEFSLVVFSVGNSLRKAPSGRELPTKSGEGERVAIKQVQDKVARAPSVTLRVPPSSRRKAYVRAVSLLIVGSGFCPICVWISTRYACPGRKRRESGKYNTN